MKGKSTRASLWRRYARELLQATPTGTPTLQASKEIPQKTKDSCTRGPGFHPGNIPEETGLSISVNPMPTTLGAHFTTVKAEITLDIHLLMAEPLLSNTHTNCEN